VSFSFIGAVQCAATPEDDPDAVTGAGAEPLDRPTAAAIEPPATISTVAATAVASVLRVRWSETKRPTIGCSILIGVADSRRPDPEEEPWREAIPPATVRRLMRILISYESLIECSKV
jgi:hypothetical protein